MNSIGIIGMGFVGSAISKSLKTHNETVAVYDKYKNGGIGKIEDILKTKIVFLCLPTEYSYETKDYNKEAIIEVCDKLQEYNYKGLVVLKSTVEPETTDNLCKQYSDLEFSHNPEFLTARTSFEDFHNQKHIVLGRGYNCSDSKYGDLKQLYKTFYPQAKISECSSIESETMKLLTNSFYASKIMLFNEYYQLCKNNGVDYEIVKNLMLNNEWINPMHTNVPGQDGMLGYGGACLPKDSQVLCEYMNRCNSENSIISSIIDANKRIRKYNII